MDPLKQLLSLMAIMQLLTMLWLFTLDNRYREMLDFFAELTELFDKAGYGQKDE